MNQLCLRCPLNYIKDFIHLEIIKGWIFLDTVVYGGADLLDLIFIGCFIT